jgi:integrase
MIDAHLLPAFGKLPVESITTQEIERWIATVPGSVRTRNKLLILLHGIMRRARKVYGLPFNPVADVEKYPQGRAGEVQVFSPEEVWALVRAADSEQDAAIFLTAAFTGLRQGELLALRWRDIDFPGAIVRVVGSYGLGKVTSPKSGKVRSVPLAPDVAEALARLNQREHFTADDDPVFAGVVGGHLDGAALTKRYKPALERANLRPLRFHDLRHTFGTRMIAQADIRRVQEWMGHADVQTTMRYLHYVPRAEDAKLVARAFAVEGRGGEGRGNTPGPAWP